jgi:hypothetical protein
VYLNNAKSLFRANDDKPVPCTPDEVRALEQQVGLVLPEAYKEFLLWMGHGAGGFLQESNCFYRHLLHNQQMAVALLEESNFPGSLPQDAFVFYNYEGYQFVFFRVSEGDNPPLYYYHEADEPTSFKRVLDTFSEFIEREIEAYNRSIAPPA